MVGRRAGPAIAGRLTGQRPADTLQNGSRRSPVGALGQDRGLVSLVEFHLASGVGFHREQLTPSRRLGNEHSADPGGRLVLLDYLTLQSALRSMTAAS